MALGGEGTVIPPSDAEDAPEPVEEEKVGK
jgi:hypothetical protein